MSSPLGPEGARSGNTQPSLRLVADLCTDKMVGHLNDQYDHITLKL